MNFEPTDEQRQLADSLTRYLATHYGFEQRKAILAEALFLHELAERWPSA